MGSGFLAACASDSSGGSGAGTAVGADQHAIDSTNRDFNKPIIDVQREAWRRCAPWRARIEKVNANLNEDGTHGADVTDWTFDCTHPKPVLSITVPGAISSQDRQLMLDAIYDSASWMDVQFVDSSGHPLQPPQ